MKVSLKMLKLFCYESWGCILRRSPDTRHGKLYDCMTVRLYDREILSLS